MYTIHGTRRYTSRPISPREIEVLDLFERGYGAKGVARELHISYETVRTHQKNIYRKLRVRSLVQALIAYHREADTPRFNSMA